jgi:hypothetical protein
MPQRTSVAAACLSGIFVAVFPLTLAAQTNLPADTFRALAGSVEAGQRIVVTTTESDRIRGRVRDIDASVLLLEDVGRIREFRESDVLEIRKRGDRLSEGALLGAGAGAGAGALVGQSRCHSEQGFCAGVGALLGLGAGAGIGLAVDALTRNNDVLYARPQTTTQRWTIEPLIGLRGYTVRFARRF